MKIQKTALFVVPCYYEGTSFERIYTAIRFVIERDSLPIDILVGDKIKNTLSSGALDDERYTKAQAAILPHLLSKVASGQYDRILFIDFFNPGMELVRYLGDQIGFEVKMASLLHGGTFIEGDLYSDAWVQQAEKLWMLLYRRVYVPSQYAFSSLPDELKQKAKIYPWGTDNIVHNRQEAQNRDKRFDVIFPHRLNKDKGLDDLIKIVRLLPGVKFLITSPTPVRSSERDLLESADNVSFAVCETTDELHEMMKSARIVLSCARQELFGYSVAEAVALGCIPVAPKNQVYTELYSESNLYETIDDCVGLIISTLKNDKDNYSRAITATSFEPLLNDFLEL